MDDEVLESDGALPAAEEDLSTRAVVERAVEEQRQRTSTPAEKPEKPEKVEATDDGRARDEKGRFVPKEDSKPEEVEKEPVEAKEGPIEAKEPETKSGPPAALSAALKHDWDKLPQNVRDEFVRREGDYLKSVERYQGLAAFANLAERNGTTLGTAVANYNRLENILIRDPVAGIDEIIQRLNIDPRALTSAMQAKYGGLYEPQTQGQQPGPQIPYNGNGYATPPFLQNPEAIYAEAERRFEAKLSERDAFNQIEAFKSNPANKFFENVRNEMSAIISSGLTQKDGSPHTLQSAYETACRMNPEIYNLLYQPQPATDHSASAQKARAAAKAVGGSPRPGLKPGGDIDTNLSTRDVVLAAINAQRGIV